MKVLLIVPSLNIPSFKGLAKLSSELVKGLKNRVDIEIYEVYRLEKSYFKNFLNTPMKQIFCKADIVHSMIPESATFLDWIKKFKNIKNIVTFHDLIPLKMVKGLDFKYKKLVTLYTIFMWKNACNCDVVVANSKDTARDVEKFLGRKVDYIINPGVDDRFKPVKVRKDKITLGFFANWSYRKNVKAAIEVFKIVKRKIDCRLIIAGGPLKTLYQKQWNVMELVKGLKDVVVFTDYVPDEKVPWIYNSFDFYLFPSVYEGYGIPILEAQASGVPTLTFSWAKIPEEVKKETIQCLNVQEMASHIIALVNNRKEYERIRRKGIEYAKRFTWKNFVDNYFAIYKQLVRA